MDGRFADGKPHPHARTGEGKIACHPRRAKRGKGTHGAERVGGFLCLWVVSCWRRAGDRWIPGSFNPWKAWSPPALRPPEQLHEAVRSGPSGTGTGLIARSPLASSEMGISRTPVFVHLRWRSRQARAPSEQARGGRASGPSASPAAGAFVLFEATGAYDRLLGQALAHCDGGGGRAVLAAMARPCAPQPHSPDTPERARLTALVRRREEPRGHPRWEPETQRRPRSRNPPRISTAISPSSTRPSALRQAHRHTRRSPSRPCARPHRGCAPCPASARWRRPSVALLPELGSRSPKTIAALVGLAPFNHDSGRKHSKGTDPRRAEARARCALYGRPWAAARARARPLPLSTKPSGNRPRPSSPSIALARKILHPSSTPSSRPKTLHAMSQTNTVALPLRWLRGLQPE